jgi:hypothetical protein
MNAKKSAIVQSRGHVFTSRASRTMLFTQLYLLPQCLPRCTETSLTSSADEMSVGWIRTSWRFDLTWVRNVCLRSYVGCVWLSLLDQPTASCDYFLLGKFSGDLIGKTHFVYTVYIEKSSTWNYTTSH